MPGRENVEKSRPDGRPSGRAGEVIVLAWGALVPLAMWLGFADNVEAPKHLILSCSVLLLVALGFLSPEGLSRSASSPLALPLVLLSVHAMLSAFLSVSPAVAWAGEEGSWRGAASLVSVWLGATAASGRMDSRLVRKFVSAVLASSVVVLGYSLLQALGADPFPWNPAVKTSYWVFATLGNPVHLGAFLAVVFLLSFVPLRIPAPLLWLFRFLVLLGILATKSRSAILALLVGVAVMAARRWRRVPFPSVALLGAAPVALPPVLESFERLFHLTRLVGARPALWEAAARMAVSSPLFGFGPDLFYSWFPSFSSYAFFMAEPPAVTGELVAVRLPASPHFELGEMAAATGMVGLGLYLWALAAALRAGIRSPLLPAAVALFVSAQSNPMSAANSVLFWMLVAAMAARSVASRPVLRAGKRVFHVVFAMVLAGLPALAAFSSLRTAVAQANRREVDRLAFFGMTQDALARAIGWSRFTHRIHPRQAQLDAALLVRAWEGARRDGRLADRAVGMLETAQALNPRNMFYLSAAADLAFERGKSARDRAELERAESLYRRAISVAPVIASLHDDLARVLDALGRRTEAAEERERSRSLDAAGLFRQRPEIPAR